MHEEEGDAGAGCVVGLVWQVGGQRALEGLMGCVRLCKAMRAWRASWTSSTPRDPSSVCLSLCWFKRKNM